MIGNGHSIPICGNYVLSTPFPPLLLSDVLHIPPLTKNLVSAHQFTLDNNVYVEYDPIGFSSKNFLIGYPIMQCNRSGAIYLITYY